MPVAMHCAEMASYLITDVPSYFAEVLSSPGGVDTLFNSSDNSDPLALQRALANYVLVSAALRFFLWVHASASFWNRACTTAWPGKEPEAGEGKWLPYGSAMHMAGLLPLCLTADIAQRHLCGADLLDWAAVARHLTSAPLTLSRPLWSSALSSSAAGDIGVPIVRIPGRVGRDLLEQPHRGHPLLPAPNQLRPAP